MRNRILAIVAVICGLGAAAGTFLYLNELKETYRSAGQFRPVVVAATRIPARTAITAPMVRVREVPEAYVHPGAFARPEEVLGKVTRAEVVAGEQILRERLLSEGEGRETLAAAVPPGRRAVAVAVDAVSGVAGAVVPGDRVDVVGTFDVEGPLSTVFLQGLQVLAVSEPDLESKTGAGPRTVTLAVTPQEAQALALVSEKGRLRLLLRSPRDQEAVALPATRLRDLVR
ncbi:MAG: Flp pilus assembly protein CpaB [Firmicutes bacterium]|nr:Flp pilus assembly protein CpaB [Bacillota bacterium]